MAFFQTRRVDERIFTVRVFFPTGFGTTQRTPKNCLAGRYHGNFLTFFCFGAKKSWKIRTIRQGKRYIGILFIQIIHPNWNCGQYLVGGFNPSEKY